MMRHIPERKLRQQTTDARSQTQKKDPVRVSSLLSVVFSLAYGIFAIGYLPIFLTKIKQAPDRRRLLKERLGIFPESQREKFAGQKVIWIHAVSVGEVMAIRKFLEELLNLLPEYSFLLTTVTPTGQRIAKEMESERVIVAYFSFDITFACRRFMTEFHPDLILLAETEIWPNLLIEAARADVPVGILNARLSEKSFHRYHFLGSLFRVFFRGLYFVLAQTQQDAKRFRKLGVPAGRVDVLGNMKFDNVSIETSMQQSASLKRDWGFQPDDLVWIAGSTHPGEEEIIFRVFRSLRENFPSLKLILAPRHIERSPDILKLAARYSFVILRATGPKGLLHRGSREESLFSTGSNNKRPPSFEVLILDKMGILKSLYAIADIIFMGGSLVRHGGQNPIEPAAVRKTVIYGPHIFNFKQVYQTLNEKGAAVPIQKEPELREVLERLLRDPEERKKIGNQAFATVQQFRGATARHIEKIIEFVGAGLKPAPTRTNKERIRDGQFREKIFPPAGGRL